MKNSTNFFDKTFQYQIYEQMLRAGEKNNLTETLMEMQTTRGIDPVQAKKTAQICIAAVASCEGIRDAVSEDAMAVFDQFLDHLKTKSTEDQEMFLHKLYFGLTAHQDANLVAELERGVSTHELFWRYYSRQTMQLPHMSAAELENRIRQALGSFYLSPQVMKALTKKMENTGDYLATAAALGENGANYKCIVAMEIYLNHSDSMTIHEAANMACAGVQTQAVADAVSKGFLSRELAKKILIAAAIAAVVIGVGILLYNVGVAMTATKTATAMAKATNAASVVELPAVFTEFATTTTATGAPAMQLMPVGSDMIASWAAAIKKKALVKQIIGTVTAVFGVAMAALSDKTATMIGKFSTMIQKDKTPVVTGLNVLADSVEDMQCSPAELDPQEEEQEAEAQVEDQNPVIF